MGLIDLKTILAFVALALGMLTAAVMLSLQGRPQAPENPGRLRAIHRVSGYLFLSLVVVLAVLGAVILRGARDALPLRGVVHWVLGTLLLLLVLLKVILVRQYKKFMKMAPALGLTILVLVFLVAAVSAGYVLLTGGFGGGIVERIPVIETALTPGGAPESGSADRAADDEDDESAIALGKSVYDAQCAGCHLRDSRNQLVGPGLDGLFGRESLSATGEEVTRETVREQIVNPTGTMPAFETRLRSEELSALVSYLETL